MHNDPVTVINFVKVKLSLAKPSYQNAFNIVTTTFIKGKTINQRKKYLKRKQLICTIILYLSSRTSVYK